MDFVNFVQADAVKAALAGTPQAALPVLAIAAPFNRAAAIPAGDVTVRDVAGLYIFDNTLLGVSMTGAQVKDYLEFSAQYFKPRRRHRAVPVRPGHQRARPRRRRRHAGLQLRHHGRPDAALTYDIDIAKAVGVRITDLAYDGAPGGRADAVRGRGQQLPAVRRRQLPARQDRAGRLQPPGRDPPADHRLGHANKVIDPSTFLSVDWKLVSNGAPVTITG